MPIMLEDKLSRSVRLRQGALCGNIVRCLRIEHALVKYPSQFRCDTLLESGKTGWWLFACVEIHDDQIADDSCADSKAMTNTLGVAANGVWHARRDCRVNDPELLGEGDKNLLNSRSVLSARRRLNMELCSHVRLSRLMKSAEPLPNGHRQRSGKSDASSGAPKVCRDRSGMVGFRSPGQFGCSHFERILTVGRGKLRLALSPLKSQNG